MLPVDTLVFTDATIKCVYDSGYPRWVEYCRTHNIDDSKIIFAGIGSDLYVHFTRFKQERTKKIEEIIGIKFIYEFGSISNSFEIINQTKYAWFT